MARNTQQERKLALANRMAEQRVQISLQQDQLVTKITSTKQAIQQKLNIPNRIVSNVKEHPVRWFCISAAAGLLISQTLFRPRKRPIDVKEKTTKNSFGKSIRSYLLRTWLTNAAKDYISSRMEQH